MNKFSHAIHAIYNAASMPDLWPNALHAIAESVGALGGVMILLRSDGNIATIVSPDLIEAQKAYEEQYYELDFMAPRLKELAIISGSDCFTEQDLASATEIASHPFLRNLDIRMDLDL